MTVSTKKETLQREEAEVRRETRKEGGRKEGERRIHTLAEDGVIHLEDVGRNAFGEDEKREEELVAKGRLLNIELEANIFFFLGLRTIRRGREGKMRRLMCMTLWCKS
jgi:hypothetical protein